MYFFYFQALKHLHDHELVHMDIKPENIFISDNDVCKLGDFGLMLDLRKVCHTQFSTNILKMDPEYAGVTKDQEIEKNIYNNNCNCFLLMHHFVLLLIIR